MKTNKNNIKKDKKKKVSNNYLEKIASGSLEEAPTHTEFSKSIEERFKQRHDEGKIHHHY
ncbi:MAG: hypothetical protein P4L16_07050 [Chlamydiales bacterium]|nr:hypothetical protein [Chlamydiales bacterium]